MATPRFAHLHCHSHYSLLDGASTIPDLVKEAKAKGMTALALTDHGNLYGAVEFYVACKEAGINPVVGYEAYVAPGHRGDKSTRADLGGEASFHLTMLAQNRTGVRNLVKLATAASLEGFYYKPRIDKELIEAHSEGLVILSGCVSSEFSSFLLKDRLDEAQKVCEWFAKRFKDRFYVEIQDNGLDIQKQQAAGAIEVANRVGLPLVATCDSHYLCADDAYAHEVLLAINTGKTMADPKRLQYGSNQFYLKSPAEMAANFPRYLDAVNRAAEIADAASIDLDLKSRHFPIFVPPPGKDDKAYLRELCLAGIDRRWPAADAKHAKRRAEAQERLDHELGIINKLGFASYFLIVWDFVSFSLANGIACGARGSACGALVSYLLEFSNVDPLEYDLLFERFLDPSRTEAPDIDIDFDQNRRDEVIEYVRQKYGEKNVAQIVTFNTMAARGVLKDVGRALEMPLARVDALTKQVPQRPKITLDEALAEVPELRREIAKDPDVKRLFDVGRRLEGLARNPGVHAAGVVVADQDLTEYVPLQKTGDVVTTQWEMSVVEKVGILKFDFLGLRTLTLVTAALRLVEKVRGVKLDLLKIPLDDPKVYDLLRKGETKGVFQLESEGFRSLLVRMRPDRFTDIIAAGALYRPGPLGGGMVDTYINVKHGREKPEYAHAVMRDVLEETYGVMVYQEQVMRILSRLGGIDLPAAYKAIKAISKKTLDAINKNKAQFVSGAKGQGLAEAKAGEIFDLIEKFAGYGFNKSHSTAYALVTYQTAYLKAHYPAEFMAALLSSEVDKTALLAEHIQDSRRMGVDVRPPDVNVGDVNFTVAEGAIRFGLLAIKGVGEKAVEHLVAERERGGKFKNLFDLCERVDPKIVSKACLESLIKAGAMDSFGAKRRQLLEVLPAAYTGGVTARDARESGQGSLFGGDDEAVGPAAAAPLPDLPEWGDQEKLGYERDLLGVYLSSHPLAEREPKLRLHRTHRAEEIAALAGRSEVVVGGMLTGIRAMTQKNGRNANQRYARFAFTDLSGTLPCVMFADAYSEFVSQVAEDAIVFLRCEVDTSREEVGLIANEVISLETAAKRLAGSLVVRFASEGIEPGRIDALARIFKGRPGASPVFLEVLTPDGLRVRMKTDPALKVACDEDLARQVEGLLGESCAVAIRPVANGGPPKRAPAPPGRGYGNGKRD